MASVIKTLRATYSEVQMQHARSCEMLRDGLAADVADLCFLSCQSNDPDDTMIQWANDPMSQR